MAGDFGAKVLTHCGGQTIWKDFGGSKEQLLLKIRTEQAVDQLVEGCWLRPAANHVGEFCPSSLRADGAALPAGEKIDESRGCFSKGFWRSAEDARERHEPRQLAEAFVAAEEFVAAGAGEGDRQAGFLDGAGNVIGIDSVEGGLVEAVEGGFKVSAEFVLGEFRFVMAGADHFGDLFGDGAFIVFRFVEGQGERVDGRGAGAGRGWRWRRNRFRRKGRRRGGHR